MEEKSLGSGGSSEHGSGIEGPHGERRRRAHEILAVQESYLERLENELTAQLQLLADEVQQSVQLSEAASGEQGESAAVSALQTQLDALKQQFEALDAQCEQLRGQNDQARLDQARLEQELRVRETLLKESQCRDEQRHVESAALRQELADVQAQFSAARNRQTALEQELTTERDRFETRLEETKAQRRRIAREFKQQRAEHLAELAERKAELETLARTSDRELQAQLEALKAELQRATEEHARELAELRNTPTSDADPAALQELRKERDQLSQRLAMAEAKLTEAASDAEQDPRKRDELQRRFEMAVEEVRELKRTNAELENKLKSRGGNSGAGGSPAPGGGLDWEAQKQRLLASLEADSDDEDDEAAREERTSIEGTIRITDQIVAQKDLEIAELKEQLEHHVGMSDSSLSSAAAELLDNDEVIRQEREKLSQMQAEWREKIGEAEIEISVQRAKLARERAEVDEKLRQLQIEQENHVPHEDSSEPGKPVRGRWLARLGLKDLDEGK